MRCNSVVIADRHPVVLLGLSKLLEGHCDFIVVACCSDGSSCIEALRNLVPDIAIIDASISGATGSEILSIVNSENISTRLVFFTATDKDRELAMSVAPDRYSVIPKDVAPEVLLQSLRQIAEGRALLPQPSSGQTASREQGALTESALTTLTDRERQIMRLVSEGLSNKEVGRRLSITDGTIKVHLHHIFKKLEISNRTVLAALAISHDDPASPPEDKPVRAIWLD
ncbi:response regulator transcription factor [Tardiphaga sp.]|uniref:LuxR C-terminal-related transcriptional regulator n=1 Tax=Tardiphaga sp. TaxID=1926292 RepID=UPI00262B71C7|nr:response regulator transcription factor [Tardiphaga sp.]MDB5618261.1 two-component response regulator [Tardiphaga sp.]